MAERMTSMGVVVRVAGGPEALEWAPLDTPAPVRGEVLIEQHAIGVNFIDTYFRSGLYPWPATPLIPGAEAAGVVVQVGEAVADLKVGDRVAYTMPLGAYRTLRVVAAERLVKLPPGIAFDVAASVMLKGLTAQFLLTSCFPVRAGHTVLVHAGRRGRAAPRPVAEGPGGDIDRHGRLARKGRPGAGQRLYPCHRLSRR